MPILVPDTAPAIVDRLKNGEDWLCHCGTLLARAIHPRQLLNLFIRCPDCEKIAATPELGKGEPIAGWPALTPPGRYRLGSPLSGNVQGSALVGPEALEQYGRETGLSMPGIYEPPPRNNEGAPDGEWLRRMAARLERALGDRLASLTASDARATKSPTPPGQRQRIIELISFARVTADAFYNAPGQTPPPVDVDGELLAELTSLIGMLDRWNNHPAMPDLLATLSHQTEPQHTLMLLVIASYLADAGNGVGLYFGETPGKVADMWLQPSLGERLELELKVPLALRSPDRPLSPEAASRVIEKAIKKAHGQLRTGSSHMLAIGGLHIGESIQALEIAARKLLHNQRGRRQQFMGILIADMSFRSTPALGRYQGGFNAVLEPRVVMHRGYAGTMKLVHDPREKNRRRQ